MQGIRKDHVEFRYSAANQAQGVKGDHRSHVGSFTLNNLKMQPLNWSMVRCMI